MKKFLVRNWSFQIETEFKFRIHFKFHLLVENSALIALTKVLLIEYSIRADNFTANRSGNISGDEDLFAYFMPHFP